MGLGTRNQSNTTYLQIVGGNITKSAKEGDEGAVAREYEDINGNKKVKYEYQFSDLSGRITDIKFEDGKFGEECRVTFKEVDDTFLLNLKTNDRYFQEFAKRLPNVDLSQDIKVVPYDFTPDGGKRKQGVNIYQASNKLGNYYFDSEKKKELHGFPSVSAAERKAGMDSDDWKMYYIKVKKFLKTEISKIDFSKYQSQEQFAGYETVVNEPEVVTVEDDMPF